MRWISIVVCSAALAGAAIGGVAQSAPVKAPAKAAHIELPPAPKALLPDSFAGWSVAGAPKKLNSAAEADAANAAALKEYDFSGGVEAQYKRGSETLDVRALQFSDVTGAFGAYSYYRQNGWPKADIGTGATSDHNRVLFWTGNSVVDANFKHIGPMSASELRELAGGMPVPEGGKALKPPILLDLPQTNLDGQTMHYALGAAGYAGSGGVLPAELVGFENGAETVTANYSLRSGPATLTIIDYPTPQMAAAEEAKIRAYIKGVKEAGHAQPGWTKGLQNSDLVSLEVRRSGPLVALVSGDAIPEESHKLLATVHYESELASIPQPVESDVMKTSKLLLGIAVLCLIGIGAAIVLAFFLGGGRALYRIARGKPASSVYDTEFISLHLRD